jgi:hypothetical protein
VRNCSVEEHKGRKMIDRMRGLSEAVEYWSLKAHPRKGIAEVEFVRPGGGRITLTIPLNQLGELKRDLDREVPNAEENHVAKKKI